MKKTAGDAMLLAPQFEPCCSTISNLQAEIHIKFAPHSICIKIL